MMKTRIRRVRMLRGRVMQARITRGVEVRRRRGRVRRVEGWMRGIVA